MQKCLTQFKHLEAGNFKGEKVDDESMLISEYSNKHKLSNARIYLLSKRKSILEIAKNGKEMDYESEDFEVDEVHFPPFTLYQLLPWQYHLLPWFIPYLNNLYECWMEKKHIRIGKLNVQTILREVRGLYLDQVSGANDNTSNDGNQARRFFHVDSADAVVFCVNPKYKGNIKKLHQNLSVLLRLIHLQYIRSIL